MAGLGNLLCKINSVKELAEAARTGNFHNCDIYISDLFKDFAIYHHFDVLIGSFGKNKSPIADSSIADKADALFNMFAFWVAETIVFIYGITKFETIVFFGGVAEVGKVVSDKIVEQLRLLDYEFITCIFPEKSTYVNALGAALSAFENESEQSKYTLQ